jgi:hypothetical protein
LPGEALLIDLWSGGLAFASGRHLRALEKNWRRLDGHNQLPKIILGVRFTDGMEVVKPKAQAAAA